MPLFPSRRRILAAARLAAEDLHAIEAALKPTFPNPPKWNFWSGHMNLSEGDLDTLLKEASALKGWSYFEMVADRPDATIRIEAGEDGSFLRTEFSNALGVEITGVVRTIEGIFRDRRRRADLIPRPIARLPGVKRLAASPSLKIGAPGAHVDIDWNLVAQNVVTNWFSHVITGVPSFALGLVAGLTLKRIIGI